MVTRNSKYDFDLAVNKVDFQVISEDRAGSHGNQYPSKTIQNHNNFYYVYKTC